MIRISTIFIAICMVMVAASLGLVLYSMAGVSGLESAIAALTALTFLILYNAVSMRLRDRTDVGGQIADLSRGTADLARQVAEFGPRHAEERDVRPEHPAHRLFRTVRLARHVAPPASMLAPYSVLTRGNGSPGPPQPGGNVSARSRQPVRRPSRLS